MLCVVLILLYMCPHPAVYVDDVVTELLHMLRIQCYDRKKLDARLIEYIHIYDTHTHIYTYMYIYIYEARRVFVCVCVHVCVCLSLSVFVCVCVCVSVFSYIHIYTYTIPIQYTYVKGNAGVGQHAEARRVHGQGQRAGEPLARGCRGVGGVGGGVFAPRLLPPHIPTGTLY